MPDRETMNPMSTPASTACDETIVAIATGATRAGIGVVRVSGPGVRAIAVALAGRLPRPRIATLVRLREADGETIDSALVLYFAAPASFTGEEVLEIHAHGSPVVLERLVARCVALGARHARAGEFSERAFLNGKLDLVQAEAVADLIAAGSLAQARAALRSLDGAFSSRVNGLFEALVGLRVYVEAAIDFPEEEIDFLADGEVLRMLRTLRGDLDALLVEARQGQRLRDGLHVVIIGRPNAGKSSLLNALAGRERAIVTAIPGTTRDVLEATVQIGAVELTLVDTAGLRVSDDPVEAEGIRRARAELARADLALLVVDASRRSDELAADLAALAAEGPAEAERLVLANKWDLVPAPEQSDRLTALGASSDDPRTVLPISAASGEGLDTLRAALAERAGATEAGGSFSARARHVAALESVAAHLAEGERQLIDARAGELLAEELRAAQRHLGEITGAYTSDDLLGAIFSSFCIGK
jgi:tRNA modification GTPase